MNGPAGLAVAMAIGPRIFRYADNLFRASGRRAHVLCARAKGLSDYRLLVNHIYPSALPELIALAGVSVNIALGAVIPVDPSRPAQMAPVHAPEPCRNCPR